MQRICQTEVRGQQPVARSVRNCAPPSVVAVRLKSSPLVFWHRRPNARFEISRKLFGSTCHK